MFYICILGICTVFIDRVKFSAIPSIIRDGLTHKILQIICMVLFFLEQTLWVNNSQKNASFSWCSSLPSPLFRFLTFNLVKTDYKTDHIDEKAVLKHSASSNEVEYWIASNSYVWCPLVLLLIYMSGMKENVFLKKSIYDHYIIPRESCHSPVICRPQSH